MNTAPGIQQPAAVQDQKVTETLRAAFARYQAELLGMLYYLVGNTDDAYDAFGEAFHRCWRRRDSMPGEERLRPWIFQIGLTVGRDLRSTAWRRRHRELPEEEELIRPQDASAGVPQRARQLVQLRRALLGLRCEEQEVFLLLQNGQMSYEEIAEATKVPLATVKMRMRLALGKLHEALDDGA
ncbi:MAG: sigma-70 family RNA polymerase sigma factor [Thermoguttaceae bacterium]